MTPAQRVLRRIHQKRKAVARRQWARTQLHMKNELEWLVEEARAGRGDRETAERIAVLRRSISRRRGRV